MKLSDYKGKIVVLQWFNEDCPFIQRHYEAKTFSSLNDKYADKGVVQLAIDSTGASTPADNQKWVSSHALKFPILQDRDHKVAKAYGARTTPHMFVIDKDGKVAYTGAIDNDPEGDKTDRIELRRPGAGRAPGRQVREQARDQELRVRGGALRGSGGVSGVVE